MKYMGAIVYFVLAVILGIITFFVGAADAMNVGSKGSGSIVFWVLAVCAVLALVRGVAVVYTDKKKEV